MKSYSDLRAALAVTVTVLLAILTTANAQGAIPNTPYAPVRGPCPAEQLVRPAFGSSPLEVAYSASRQIGASQALEKWLKSTGLDFDTPRRWPVLGLTTSGGGDRSWLTGAGVHQALDGRDSSVSTSGLYQALTYEAALSGGAWLLSSLAANNWPTVSSLAASLWVPALTDSVFVYQDAHANATIEEVTIETLSKAAAGFEITVTDPYGLLTATQLLLGPGSGISDHWSDIPSLTNFTSWSVPFPIITALGIETWEGECLPPENATQYELTPYEFGSFDPGVLAFVDMKYVGTNLSHGVPVNTSTCVTGFDNTAFILGTSSSIFAERCELSPTNPINLQIARLEQVVALAHPVTSVDIYAAYPNPFYNYDPSTLVNDQPILRLADGGIGNQTNPIWPFLHRPDVDVLLVNDNSAGAYSNYPDGNDLYVTYVEARAAGLSRMPFIPTNETFLSEGLLTKPTFFGCDTPETLTIVYLPNTNYTFNSGVSTFQLAWTAAAVEGMIGNGVEIATYGRNSTWGGCLACGIMLKSGTRLPKECWSCLEEFCYRNGTQGGGGWRWESHHGWT